MNNSWKRFLSLLLAMVMVLSLGVTGFAEEGDTKETPADIAEGSIASAEEEDGADPAEDPAEDALPGDGELEMEEISPDKVHIRKLGLEEEEDLGEIVPMDEEDLNTVVRASIFLEEPATLAAGYSAKGVGTNSAAIGYRDALKARQAEMTAQIESVIGHELNVHWNMTLAVNAISADLSLGEMVKVREIPGVRSVERENRYLPMDEGSISEPETANTSENMTGATAAWAAGYTGAGSKIAIIDTGIDTSHQSFAEEPFTWSVGQAGASGELMTKAQVQALAGQLNSGTANYVSAKIPYGYNYVDGNTTIDHLSDSEGNHGSHVAGIAAANRYIGSAHQDAAATVGAVGMAPDAQLFVMKVFGVGGGAYDSDYMVAIEDAMVLGADACNLSLGSGDPGWSFDNTYQDYMNGWADGTHNGDMVLTISAGNSYAATSFTNTRAPYIEDVYTHTGGSPGSFVNSLCVAAAQNTLTTGTPMLFNGTQDVFYYESTADEDSGTTYTNPELSTIVGSYNYVYIDAAGTPEEFSAVNGAVSLSGKVVIVNRGEINFSEKGNNAKSYNPKAVIVANNMDGTILMNLADYTGTFPMVSITLKDANQIKAGGTAQSVNGISYYTGSMQVTNNYKEVVIDRSQATITDFSSWGVPGSLLMKPEITAPGGDIYSVYGTAKKPSGGSEGGAEAYVSYSGTSMAAPHMAGLTAVLAERIREENLKEKNPGLGSYSIRAITQSLMMSTATPMAPDGEFLSILQQGAGLAEVSKAASSNSVIMMDPANSGLTGLTGAAADGKVKAELGDDPARKGDYSFGFTVYNLSDEDITFDVNTEVFTQAVAGEFMSNHTAILGVSATKWWAPLDGGSVPNLHDVNKDGRTDELDATAILDYVSGEKEAEELDLAVADLDQDERISSQDAYLLLGFAAEQGSDTQDGLVPAHGSRYCAVRITLPAGTKGDLDGSYPGGAFLEGFTTVKAVGTTKDGGVYTDEHSIPILGFYGSWTDASMFETTSYIEGLYGSEQLPYSGNSDTNCMRLQMNGATVKFTGNPYQVEGSRVTDFPSERLAINSSTNIQSIAYNLIRSAGTTGFAVSRLENGEITEVLGSSVVGNEVTGLWYYVNQATWQNTGTKLYTINKNPASYGLAEGDTFRIGFYAIPEYNAMLVNDSYNTGTAGMLDQAGFNSLLLSGELGKGAFVGYDFTVDNTDPQILSANLDGTTITVSAADNQNLAYVAVLSLDGETIYAEDVPAMPTCELSFDASEAIANAHGYVAVFAGDYAGNESAMAVKVNDNTWEEKTVYVLSDTLTAGEDYLIVNTNTTGTGYALGYTAGSFSNTVATNRVSIKSGTNETGNKAYIDSKDVAETSVWSASGSTYLRNGSNYLRRSANNSTTLNISATNTYNTWQYSSGQLRFTDKATYLRYNNNSFSLTNSASNIYLFQKTVIRTEVDPYSISGVTVTPETASLYKGAAMDLTAKVFPLTATDRSVSWSSSDPNVATVDASGKVTGVNGSASGMSAVITATANGDSTKKAECTVTVYCIEKNLNGIVWDEAGAVYFSGFNSSSLPTWNKLHNNDLGVYLMNAMMFNSSTLYASVCDPSGDSPLYTVNRSSYALTEYGMNYVPPFGMARGLTGFSSQGYDFFLYGFANYLVLGGLAPEEDGYYDEETGNFIGNGEYYTGMPYATLNLSTTGVGDAYVCAVAARTVSSASASYYFLDETGKIWQTTVSYNQGFNFSTPTLVVDTGIGTSFQYQSLYYDGTYLFWSHYADNETDLIIIEPSTGRIFNAGNFGEGVWPVGGLFVNGSAAPAAAGDEPMDEAFRPVRVATREQLMTPDVMERLAEAFGFEVETPLPETEETPEDEGSIEAGGSIAPVEPILEPVPAEDGQNSAYTGSLTAFRGYVAAVPTVRAAEPQGTEQSVTIDIAESQDSHNGMIAVEFNPDLVSFVNWTDGGNSSNLSVHPDDKGVVTIAYANKDKNGDDIEAGAPIVTLNFSVADLETLPCNVIANTTTVERNDLLELNEWADVTVPGAEGHDWGEPSWTWAADYSDAEATFVCKNDASHTETVVAEVSSETVDGVTTYTATVFFQGRAYTDTRTSAARVASNITSCSTNFEGKLQLNVYIVLSEEIAADPGAYVSATFSGETTKHS
ncbi:MAG: S8 family serine peptidase, partial [Oscillospiraceae bacterium]|nr:S8 family serine peptidase [Oscillospiraceae bacterium]